jgi:hypothetical protein
MHTLAGSAHKMGQSADVRTLSQNPSGEGQNRGNKKDKKGKNGKRFLLFLQFFCRPSAVPFLLPFASLARRL